MHVITKRTHQLKLYGAVLALAALVATVLAVALAGGAQAQNSTNTFADPQPCGPGLPDANRPANPDEKVTSGRLALFDAYWDATAESLNNNLCPPSITQTIQYDGAGWKSVITNRVATNIDVTRTVINLTDDYKVTVIDSGADDYVAGAVTGPTIDLAEHPFIEDVDPGDQVWWLRLDDPDTAADETSDLQLAFSAGLLDGVYWHLEDGDSNPIEPLQYHFEAERHSLEPADTAHFYMFEASPSGSDQPEVIWKSTEAETTPMKMRPGQYRNMQWVITKAGTHRLGVHIQGHVRQEDDNPYLPGTTDHDNWQPLTHQSKNKVVTSEVVYYTFQVGSLTLNREAMFWVERSVPENSAPGVLVGDPIPVSNPDGDALTYTLSGSGHGNFVAAPTSDGRAAQIRVAPGAVLDYETNHSYDLVLGLSDGKDRESNADPAIDHTIAVKIALEDERPSATLSVDNANPAVGGTVRFTVTTRELPPGHGNLSYQWAERSDEASQYQEVSGQPNAAQWSTSRSSAGSRIYNVAVYWGTRYQSPAVLTEEIQVTWSN